MTFKFTNNLSFPQHKKTLTYCRAVSSPALDIPSPALPAANHLCHPGRWWDWVLSTWSLLRFPSKSPEILPSVWIWARLRLYFFSFYCLQLLEILTAAALKLTIILLLLKFIQKLLKETWSHPKVPHSHTTTFGDSFQWFQLRLRVGEERGVASSPKIIEHENYFFIDFQKNNFSFFTNSNLGNICPPPQGHMLGFNAFMEQRLGSRSPSLNKSNRRPTWGVQSPT